MRRLTVLLSLLSVCSGLAEQIRVTTWKLSAVSPATEEKYLADAAAELKKLNPDVVLLQEVRDRQSCDKLATLLQPARYLVIVCSAFQEPGASNKRQVAILSKKPAYAAWAENWKTEGTVDPPGGFAFAAIRHGPVDVCFYSVQLKDNTTSNNADKDIQLNILKRELSARQLARHVAAVESKINNPAKAFIVAGDFNTNPDQSLFVSENTLRVLEESGFKNAFQNLPLRNRITRPGSARGPDATLDYIFAKRGEFVGSAQIAFSKLSDRLPLTCDLLVGPPPTFTTRETAPAVGRPAVQTITQNKAWLWVAAAAGVLVCALVAWRITRRSAPAPQPLQTPLNQLPSRANFKPHSALATGRAAEFRGPPQETSAGPRWSWQQRAVAAEQRASQATAVVRAGLVPHLARMLKDKLLWKLLAQRSQLLSTQQSSAKLVTEMEQRLALVQAQFQSRIQTYERRIAELERELATKDRVNRELLGAKIQMARQALEAVKAEDSAWRDS